MTITTSSSDYRSHIAFETLMKPVALRLLGEPNHKLSKSMKLRFGTNGSMLINIDSGQFYDFENQIGGGVIDLVKHKIGCDHSGAVDWLRREAFIPEAEKKPTFTCGYDCTDETGALLFQVIRYSNPKTFKQRRPSEKRGKWHWNLDGVRRVIYQLPKIIAAVADGKTIFVVEGEKDCDNLRELGLAATTCPGGANKWKREYTEALHGADVIIIPDNDAAGRRHAEQVSTFLHDVAKRVRILDLAKHWPECPAGGDVSDWLEAGGDVEELATLIDALPEHTAKPNGQTSPELVTKLASEYRMRSIKWLWPNRYAIGKLGLLAGLPERGKGLISADMAARVTNGDVWPCNEGNARQGNVLILGAEDDIEDTVVPRLVAAGADMKRVNITGMIHTGGKKRMFNLVSDLELLRRKIDEIGNVVMVIIDPMSAYLGVGKVDTYRTSDVRGVLAPLVELAADKQVFILGILHFNKQTDVTNAMLRISDSLAFTATARHCYVVVDDAENKRRLLVRAKNNLAPDTKALAYSIGAKNVGTDEMGTAIYAPRVEWWPEHVEITTAEAMEAESGKSRSSPAKDAAEKFLREILADGPVDKTDIEEAAEANCISEATLRRAKDTLGVKAEKESLTGGWKWRLPEAPEQSSKRYSGDA